MAEKRPGSFEPGFFIEFVLDNRVSEETLYERDLPSPYHLRFTAKPHPDKYPSLLILPWCDEYASLFNGPFPVVCYGKDSDKALNFPAVRASLAPPCSRDRMTALVSTLLEQPDFPLPGGYIKMGIRCLKGPWGALPLTKGEELLLRALLCSPDGFRTYRELEILTGRKGLKSLLSRLRSKLSPLMRDYGPVSLEFTSIRSTGCYLGITVENL
ncbi:MAG: hypothetical protein JXA95_02530 [Spirochaetales bacterium]|nr:hypothetical protein [Spirochaetales bacterium]